MPHQARVVKNPYSKLKRNMVFLFVYIVLCRIPHKGIKIDKILVPLHNLLYNKNVHNSSTFPPPRTENELHNAKENCASYDRAKHVRTVQQDAQERRMKMNCLICPRCGGSLKPREGRRGSFYGCANYPHCRFTMPW